MTLRPVDYSVCLLLIVNFISIIKRIVENFVLAPKNHQLGTECHKQPRKMLMIRANKSSAPKRRVIVKSLRLTFFENLKKKKKA